MHAGINTRSPDYCHDRHRHRHRRDPCSARDRELLGVIDHDTLTAPMRPLTDEQKALVPDLLKTIGL